MRGSRSTLIVIVVIAAIARFWGIWFGLPHTQARPDESVVAAIAIGFFGGDLNPHFFDYPTLFMYLLAGLYYAYFAVGHASGTFLSIADFVASSVPHSAPFFLIARCFSAVLGTATVVLAYRIASRLAGQRAGLVGALFLALSLIHARDSHFGVTDVAVTFLVCASIAALIDAHAERAPRGFFLAGLLAGLAASTKYNAALLLVPACISQVIEILDARRERRPLPGDGRLPLFLAPFVVGALLGTPYALADMSGLLDGFRRVTTHLEQGHGVDLGTGWTYHLAVSLRYGVGWPVLAAAFAGAALLAVRDPKRAAIVCSFPIAYYAAAGPGRTVFVRYMIPMLPFLCIMAAVAVDAATRSASARFRLQPRVTAILAACLAGLAILPSATDLVQLDYLLGRTDNRLIAARWIRERVPAGGSLYQSDVSYGGLEIEPPGMPSSIDLWDFDESRGVFVAAGFAQAREPDWIVIQQSPLTAYSRVPPAIASLVSSNRYVRVRSFIAIEPTADEAVFDRQDAFFLPLAGFRGINRPGPNFHVYQRVQRTAGR